MSEPEPATLGGKVAVITGAASGIGRASAFLFARHGAAVIVADADRAGGTATAAHITAAGGRARFVAVDVTSAAAVQTMIAAALADFGRLDVLFNNAGVGGGVAPFAEYGEEEFERVLAVNLKGVFLGMKFGIPVLVRGGGGAIINTASVAGLVGARGLAAYAASKGAVIQLTRVAALEYAAQNIRVNCICPGGVDTPMLRALASVQRAPGAVPNPLGRIAQPEEIAAAALFLAGAESSFMTGAALVVDGGMTAQ